MNGIEFHYFCDKKKHPSCQGSLTRESFLNIICYLQSNYELLNAYDFYEVALSGTGKPNQICLTFDDGVSSQWDIAVPCLEEKGITGMFFTNTAHFENKPSMLEVYHDFRFRKYNAVEEFYKDFYRVLDENKNDIQIDLTGIINRFDYNSYLPNCPWHSYEDKLFRYIRDQVLTKDIYDYLMEKLMIQKGYDWQAIIGELWISAEQLRELDIRGHLIGLHTHSHPTNINALSDIEVRTEYTQNAYLLNKILGHNVSVAAYPCGKSTEYSKSVLTSLGIHLAFTAELTGNSDLLDFSRKNHPLIVQEMISKGHKL